jgi:hypothetical protein
LGGRDKQFENLVKDANIVSILKWDVKKPPNTATFLDAITTGDGKIATRTYQKERNPYLYITPKSAHPPGMIEGVIFSLVRNYYKQDSNKKTISISQSTSSKALPKGWDPFYIKPIFHNVLYIIQYQTNCQRPKENRH